METMATYKQFDFNLERFTYTLEDEGVNIQKRTLSSYSENFRKFEEIGTHRIKEKSRKIGWLITFLFFAAISIIVFIRRIQGAKIGDNAELFWLGIGLVCLAIYMLTKTNYIYLANRDYTGSIEFINRRAYRKSLDDFIKLILEKRKEYLLEEYFELDEFTDTDRHEENLVWLYNQELITKEQLTAKMEELKKINAGEKFNRDQNVIGFRRHQQDVSEN